MKKALVIVLTVAIAVLAFAGCGSTAVTTATEAPAATEAATAAPVTITVGASSTPHAEILEQAKAALAEEGYELKIVVYDDYVLPNKALADGELDANYFQHTPYPNSSNASTGTDLVSAALSH